MKNRIQFLLLTALCLLAGSCVPALDNQILPQEENVLEATILSEPLTRTSLSSEKDGVSKVLWSENDAIGVFIDGSENANVYRLISGSGSKNGTFAGTGKGNRYVAVYPYSSDITLGGEAVSINLPAVQEYAAHSFQSGAFPMVAVSQSAEISFRNLCAVLKVSMTGHHNVTRLVFRSNDPSIKVSGPATVSLADPSSPVLTMAKNACDSLVVETGGIMLNADTPTDFYLVLPPQTYRGGFSVRIETSTGYMVKSLNSDFTMVRAQKHDAKPFAVKLDVGIESSAALEGSGTEEDPFRIGSIGDLLLMQTAVNSKRGVISGTNGTKAEASKACYLLTEDLDLTPLCSQKLKKSWTPIGDRDTDEDFVFAGVFDGGGHTVRNLYIESDQSCRGLFGYSTGKIRNLTVDGEVLAGSSDAAIIAGYARDIEYCISQGYLEGSIDVGGIVGYGDRVAFCTNRASVGGVYYTGGIVGETYGTVVNCVNEGQVVANENGQRYHGGIAGYLGAGTMINCCNRGAVYGVSFVGGMAGIAYRAKVYNCVNLGNISCSGEYVGGICGMLSSFLASESSPATVSNCINAGNVAMAEGITSVHIGSVAGFNGYYKIWNNDRDENNNWSKVSQNYWLYDASAGQGMASPVGDGNGIVENNSALTDAQLKGGKYSGILYTSSDGSAYSDLLTALNACAYDLRQQTKAALTGWEFDPASSYPMPTDLDAQKPGGGQAIFTLSASEFSFLTFGGQFSVEVTSSLDYSVGALPGWITDDGVLPVTNRAHSHIHVFTVLPNETGASRQATIQFINSKGTTQNVKVNQAGPYLTVTTTGFTLPDAGGSRRISIASSIAWNASGDASWFTVSPLSGQGNGAVSVNVSENESPTARSGSVTICSEDGSFNYTVSIVQSGYTGEETDEWKRLPFYHQSVAMRFTATWCGWCPRMNKSIMRAQELYPDKILQLALHGGGSDLQFDKVGPLMDQYSIAGFPTGIVDGRTQVENYEVDVAASKIVEAAKETENTYGTASGMGIRSSSSGQSVSIDIDAYFQKDGDYKITVLLVEDGIVNAQSDYIDGDHAVYTHDNIARVAATDVLGEPFEATALSMRTFSYTVTVPAAYKIENMRVLAYIQKKFGADPVKQTGAYGDYFVDNCATAAVGDIVKVALIGGSGGGGGESGGQGNEGITPGGEIK